MGVLALRGKIVYLAFFVSNFYLPLWTRLVQGDSLYVYHFIVHVLVVYDQELQMNSFLKLKDGPRLR